MAQQALPPSITRLGLYQHCDWVRERDVMVAMRDGVRRPVDCKHLALADAFVGRANAA